MIYEENGQYRDEIYDMWQRNFHDPAPYADFYFQEVYGKNEILLNAGSAPEMIPGEWEETPALKMMGESEEIIRGMLHLNPYELLVRGREQQAHYIVGVATDEAFRRQGVMRELLLETFSRLRKRGEPFTYLMPADENYYLPFDFRFGMKELEREIECFGKAPAAQNPRFTFEAGLPEDLSEICEAENASRGREFAICTRITPSYLTRMEKEVRSDFGRLVRVYRDGVYAGRFVMGAEDDYMVLSQVVCVEEESLRGQFLYEALYFCEQEYHYGKYQLVLEETWKPALHPAGNVQGVRLLPVRKKKRIMFRILDLERLGTFLSGVRAGRCRIRVRDAFLKEQDGSYLFTVGEDGGVRIQKTEDLSAPDGGEVSVAALTALLFGEKEMREEEWYEGLTESGRAVVDGLLPLSPVCIQEFV